MESIHQRIPLVFHYDVHFTEHLFDPAHPLLAEVMDGASDEPRRALFVVDEGVVHHHADLLDRIQAYAHAHAEAFQLVAAPLVVPGGEAAKNNPLLVEEIQKAVSDFGIDRHSYIVAVGGGAVLDLAGYAAATAHRGIRHVRIPTTVLSQNDSGVGVKNGINYFGKKNFLGTFAPPTAVLIDFSFLSTLDDRDWRGGISEAIKVALIKDADFFDWLEAHADALVARDLPTMQRLIHWCACIHLEHIATNGDPFEMGSSRPLDFGHWAAHKLEQLTQYDLRHGEAVGIGIALDTTYAYLTGILDEAAWTRVIELFERLGFSLFVPEMIANIMDEEHPRHLFSGLTEFREHLGGKLTIMLLCGIGEGVEVNEIDRARYAEAVRLLQERAEVDHSAEATA